MSEPQVGARKGPKLSPEAKEAKRYAELAKDKSAPLADFLRDPSLLPKRPPGMR